jgi:pimeloyl-ACP methyl ester carboxylesterase
MRPPVQFCASSDGARLAFAVCGDGPPLVRAPHWFTHLEHDWTNPAMRPWVEDLSKRYRLLRFDQRRGSSASRCSDFRRAPRSASRIPCATRSA